MNFRRKCPQRSYSKFWLEKLPGLCIFTRVSLGKLPAQDMGHNLASAPHRFVSPILVFGPGILLGTHDSQRAKNSQSTAGLRVQQVFQSVE